MKKSLIALLLTSFLIVNGSAQNYLILKRGYAFYTVSIPGMAMADEKGNVINPKPTIDRFLYIETIGIKPPDITNVSYDKANYAPVFTNVGSGIVHVGKSETGGNEITLIAREGYTIWKVDLHLFDEKAVIPAKVKNILVAYKEGSRERRYSIYRISKETQLMTPDRY
jgi:hypothetical protein